MLYPVSLFSSLERLCKSDENKIMLLHIYHRLSDHERCIKLNRP